MSKANSLGGGLQTEMTAIRLRMAAAQRHEQAAASTAAAPPAPAAVPQRKVLAFRPKLPGVSKKVAKPPATTTTKGRTRLVVKVKVKSPFLQRRLGL